MHPEESLRLGVDIGSVSVKIALLDNQHNVLHTGVSSAQGRPLPTLCTLLADARTRLGDVSIQGMRVTGSGKTLITPLRDGIGINEIVAHGHATATFHPRVRSIIEIGGQDSKFIALAPRQDNVPRIKSHAFNGVCSAGTGAFLETQAALLGLNIEEFSRLAAGARHIAPVAGRCSVFAKSDMIHHRQAGTPMEEIAAGVCHALARNFIATLCQGTIPEPPYAFQGGVAANHGMVRAFAAALDTDEDAILIPEHHAAMGAIGSALLARDTAMFPARDISRIIEAIEGLDASPVPCLDTPLSPPPPLPAARQTDSRDDIRYLGLDLGSATTKAVLLDRRGVLMARDCRPTGSRPLETITEVLTAIRKQAGEEARIQGFYATGSGRVLVQDALGAHGTVDEISAQARGAASLDPELDTIVEIGGQDAKFITLENGHIKTFVMNRICAAGTGSFIEEQAGRLGIDIEEDFARLAFDSTSPVRLGSRCSVFMESDLVHHIQQGTATADLCAGLAHACVRNYLEVVVESRHFGSRVVFQGGVARNDAVHAALEQQCGRTVRRHPTPELSGAIGAALLAREELAGQSVAPLDLDRLATPPTETHFTCDGCANACRITCITTGPGRQTFLGSRCGKYDEHREELPPSPVLTERDKLLHACATGSAASRDTMGIPLALTAFEDLPFWRTFFTSLGFNVLTSGETTPALAAEGTEHLPVETCMPVRILEGHARQLADQGAERIFIPHTPKARCEDQGAACHLCPYTQAAPYLVRTTMDIPVVTLPLPGTSVEDEVWINQAASSLDRNTAAVSRALKDARRARAAFTRAQIELGQRLLKTDAPAVVLIGRPYDLYDEHLNMGLVRHLERLGIRAVPMDLLDLKHEPLSPFWDELNWYAGRRSLQAAQIVQRTPGLGCIILTNFACGPDEFVVPYLEQTLEGTPHLVLEFDGAGADAGMVTRLEAFARILKSQPTETRPRAQRRANPHRTTMSLRDYTFCMEYFSDHAYAYLGALEACGCKTILLPPTDEESREIASQYAHGNECHPFRSVLGDLLRYRLGPDYHGEELIYYSPMYDGPCLMNQYGTAIAAICERHGIDGVHLVNIGDMGVMKELGNRYVLNLVLASYAIDRLLKWKNEIRGYAADPAQVDAVHRANMELLVRRMRQHRLPGGIREACRNMEAIPVDRSHPRPAVGIAGDIYTRINANANDGLVSTLQAQGFEPWTSSLVMDVVFLGFEQRSRVLAREGRPVRARLARAWIPVLNAVRKLMDRHFPASIRTPQESAYPALHARVAPHIDPQMDKLLSLNLCRHGEFADAGAAGVLNVACPRCMISTITQAFAGEICPVPRETLEYGDQQTAHLENRLEAFAHRLHLEEKSPDGDGTR